MTTLPTATTAKISLLQQTLEELATKAESAIKRVEQAAEEAVKQIAAVGTIPPGAKPLSSAAIQKAMEQTKMKRARRDTIPTPVEEAPKTFVGDKGDPKQLRLVVHSLLQEKPVTFRELMEQTGARETRIYGILANLRRAGAPLVHLGEKTHGKWYLVPQNRGED